MKLNRTSSGARRLVLAIASGCVVVALTAGCAGSAPSHDAAAERFAIEIAATFDLDKGDPAIQELARSLADDAVDGRCTDSDYWRLATSPLAATPWDADLQYIWAAGCSVLYQESLDDDLEAEYRDAIVRGAMDR
jgi:hypothetical protein